MLAALLVLVVATSAISPSYPADWLLENWLVFVFVGLLAAIYRRAPFSRASYVAIFILLCLHEVGAHYTYSEVPYDEWIEAATGSTLNGIMGWERNHFDRLVHFAYGLLIAFPMRELFLRVSDSRGFWSYFLPLQLIIALSAWYELIEWAAAMAFGGDLGMAYLGTQGDVWDAHKDMGLALAGATLSLLAAALVNGFRNRDPALEWIDRTRGPGTGGVA